MLGPPVPLSTILDTSWTVECAAINLDDVK